MLTYKIKPGDTLSSIARRFYGDARKYPLIAAANNLTNPNALLAGATISIPDLNSALDISTSRVASGVAVGGSSSLSEQRLTKVHPALAARGRALVELMAQQGLDILVTQGLRTWEEQDQLYLKGRSLPPLGKKYIVTNAKGGQSYHNFGLALDIVVLDSIGKADWDTSHLGWDRAASLGKSLGLEWGGDWKSFRDIPHFQYTGGLGLPRCRELYPQGLAAVWAEVT